MDKTKHNIINAKQKKNVKHSLAISYPFYAGNPYIGSFATSEVQHENAICDISSKTILFGVHRIWIVLPVTLGESSSLIV